MNWLGWILTFLWVGTAFQILPFLRHRRLEHLAGSGIPEGGWPRVSVIIPACNEAEEIETCLRSLAGQDYPDLELVAVNDRSTDDTGAIIDRLGEELSDLKAVHIRNLPDGWLGKPHAMHRGALAATGDLLLFTDGDIRFSPDTLRNAVRYIQKSNVDHLCLLPGSLNEGFFEAGFKTFICFAFLLFVRPDQIRSPSINRYVGVGAFNLIRKTAYEQIGGHAAFPLSVVDDLEMGRRVKRAGLKQDLLLACSFLRLRWHAGVWNLIRGMEKNMFAALDYSLVKTTLGSIAFLVYFLPYLGLTLLPESPSYGFLLALIIMHGLLGYVGHLIGAGWAVQFLLPVAALLELFALWRAVIKTLMQGGITWRGTFYSLETLKQGKEG